MFMSTTLPTVPAVTRNAPGSPFAVSSALPQAVAVRDSRVAFDVRDVKGRVADGLYEDQARLLVDCGLDGGEVVHGREFRLYADVRQDGVELAEGAAVEVARRHDLVACPRDVRDREVDGRRAARKGLRRCAALERRDALCEHVVRGVHQAGVDVAELAQAEEVGPVLGVAEVVCRGAVHRHGPRVGGGVAVRVLPGVDRQCLDMVLSVAHVDAPFGLVRSSLPDVVSTPNSVASERQYRVIGSPFSFR
jgi:hypothetical protein